MKWVKSTLKERFAELQLFDPSTTENFLDIKTTGLHSAKGEATVCNRKKKLFALYELDITLTFSAKVKQPNNSDKPEKVVEGKIFFPYISNENSAEDFSYRVQMDKSEDEEYRLDIHKKAEAKLRDVMTKFVQDLKSGANYALKRQSKESSGNIEPKDGATSPTPAPAIAASAKPKEASSSTSSAQPASSEFLSLNVTQKFNCRPEDLFDCFVNAQKISAYTQSKCTFANPETLKGSKFSMLNGNIEGVFEEIIPNERLEQKWRMQVCFKFFFEKKEFNILLMQCFTGLGRWCVFQIGFKFLIPKWRNIFETTTNSYPLQ